MKSGNYLIISFMLFVALSIVFFVTKNNFYYYLTIPILIYASFMRYNREKEKLTIKTTKILIFLKYEIISFTIAFLAMYLNSFFTNTRIFLTELYLFITTIISVIFLLIYLILHIKRTLLIRQELRKNNSK
ncbi:hypothetical protein CJ217_04740 [Streptococcus sp. UMB1385]|nr:hypothetical protein CJ217_04740 [Streptococcus sp. UMB1385]